MGKQATDSAFHPQRDDSIPSFGTDDAICDEAVLFLKKLYGGCCEVTVYAVLYEI